MPLLEQLLQIFLAGEAELGVFAVDAPLAEAAGGKAPDGAGIPGGHLGGELLCPPFQEGPALGGPDGGGTQPPAPQALVADDVDNFVAPLPGGSELDEADALPLGGAHQQEPA